MAFYWHKPRIIEKLRAMIADDVASVKGSMGLVDKGAGLKNCRIVKNVKVGPAGLIEGVNKLDKGSVNSCS
ncbi:DUF4954 family protein [Planctomycetota bacterium]